MIETDTFNIILKPQVKFAISIQENGKKRRALMIANAKYDANNIHKSLSITPINDIKDMLGLLEKSDTYGLENTYEDVESKNDLNDLFESYVESLNKFPEEIELLVIYYSGLVVKSEPEKFTRKRNFGLILDRVGLLNNLAFVNKDESLYPVANLQLLLAKSNSMVKRKLLIIDGRLITKNDLQIDFPVIPEKCLDSLSTIYTIYPK